MTCGTMLLLWLADADWDPHIGSLITWLWRFVENILASWLWRIVSEGACEQVDSLRRKAFCAFKNFEGVIGISRYLSLADLASDRKRCFLYISLCSWNFEQISREMLDECTCEVTRSDELTHRAGGGILKWRNPGNPHRSGSCEGST